MRRLVSCAVAVVLVSVLSSDASAQQQGSSRYSRRFDPNVPRYEQPEAYTRGGYTNLERRNRDYQTYGNIPAGDTFPRRTNRYVPPTYTYPQYPVYSPYSPNYGVGAYYPYGGVYVPYQSFGYGPR